MVGPSRYSLLNIVVYPWGWVQVAEWEPCSDEAYSLDQSLDGG